MSMVCNYLKLSEAQLAAILEDPETASDLAYPESGEILDALDLDKSWHLIHFLLTGETWSGEPPLGNVVLGGTELPETDAGYGPFRYLVPSEVREASNALASITAEDLWARFDAKQVKEAKVYPSPWIGDSTEREYVTQNYEALRRYFTEAARSGNAMLLYIS